MPRSTARSASCSPASIRNGGWPQRFPFDPRYPGYQRYVTFNDDVAKENIRFLIMAGRALDRPELLAAARRGMEAFLITQQPGPQAGWGLQYDLRLRVAGARTYEPRALVTHTSATNVEQLMEYYRLTGDRRFLARIPEALAWLESVRLPDGIGPRDRRFPTFVEIGTNRPLYVHRRGSNVVNGHYYRRPRSGPPDRPLFAIPRHRPRPAAPRPRRARRHAGGGGDARLAVAGAARPSRASSSAAWRRARISAARRGSIPARIVRALNEAGYWPAPLTMTSHPYRGPGSRRVAPGDYGITQVGDETDTSPYPDPDARHRHLDRHLYRQHGPADPRAGAALNPPFQPKLESHFFGAVGNRCAGFFLGVRYVPDTVCAGRKEGEDFSSVSGTYLTPSAFRHLYRQHDPADPRAGAALGFRHCEERSDEAIQPAVGAGLDCFAALAMTMPGGWGAP